MKLIQQSKLFFKEGKSDKVYEIDICELSPNEFLVNFRYGRRGAVLKEGTKTPVALSKEKADLLFADLENEKRKKGYQTETEVFMELPSLEAVDPSTVNGAILQRLQDAVVGKNSFKTEWKTSRVIWKAGVLDVKEAIPFIIKLATRGDEMQTYCSLWALIKLKADLAEPLFNSIANNIKQKSHITNLAWEGLLSVCSEEEKLKKVEILLEKLPAEVRFAIETNDLNLLGNYFSQSTIDKDVEYFTNLYVLAKVYTQLLPILNNTLKSWEFRPPYFRNIRAIYKLAQSRNDEKTLAILSYRFEKQKAMFKRTVSLDSTSKRYLTVIDESISVGSELKRKDSKLAFSTFTKNYFQKNAVEHFKNAGAFNNDGSYLRLAVNTLLQYTESDYSIAEEKPLSDYGRYDYDSKRYSFLLIKYPECAESLLLSTILFGNDPNRKLQPNLKFITSSRSVTSNNYYYRPNQAEEVPIVAVQPDSVTANSSMIDTAKSIFKSLFGKKNLDADLVPQNEYQPEPIVQHKKVELTRFELYPELWDARPEAYVQLLMQAQMNIIHLFAYNRIKEHPKYEEIAQQFDQHGILQLLNSIFELPNQFGFEVLKKRETEFVQISQFVAEVNGSNSASARDWAQCLVNDNPVFYFNDIDFVLSFIFNTRSESNLWINESLEKHTFSEEKIQAVLGKAITEMLHFENTIENNLKAKTAIVRLNSIAESQMEKISWTIVQQLISSALDANKILAGKILLIKAKNVDPTDIPVSLTEIFLNNDLAEVRQNGIELLNQYPDGFLAKNLDFICNLIDVYYDDVAEKVFAVIKKLLIHNTEIGNKLIPYFAYALMRKEKFEGAHVRISQFLLNDLKPYWNSGLFPKDITKLLHAQYRITHLAGYEILKGFNNPGSFSLRQIISFGSHEILAIRQWCWNYFKGNLERIHDEKDQSLYLLDAKWEDTRAFAFNFFRTEFKEDDWDPDILIGIVDSIRPDVESFGKEMITKYFDSNYALDYLTKLSQHPSINVQAFVSNYLSIYVKENPDLLQELTFYFRSVLTRVNRGRVAKDRVFSFLYNESLKNLETAIWVVTILDDVSAQTTVQDKASCIDILTRIKKLYPNVDMHLMIKN
ncbi:hypothetical protein EZJ43_06705 [Pedobacter changchengzhani]|uniref:WGR domain-containing protein n=1 Tax=Pedobacter changchengzhani TaxID=2529274 RepID=A0A4R5MN48_9SPHI|nr:hypothetical protein [Pedobacter changchengzhani]TDG36966.1 hypothetical protein EZJ43_06705 [Pedobacter changchengzhani]